MKVKFTIICIVQLVGFGLSGQRLSSSHEIRYYSSNQKANGETDFKGETTIFNTDQRIEFLKYYADEVSAYFNDKDLNTEVVSDKNAKEFLATLKPQPIPEVRQRLLFEDWNVISSRPGQHESTLQEINSYTGAKNIQIKNGAMAFLGESHWKWDFDIQSWRFFMEWKVRSLNGSTAEFLLQDNSSGKKVAKITIDKNQLSISSKGTSIKSLPFTTNTWHKIKVDVDLQSLNGEQHYSVYLDGEQVADFVPSNEALTQVNSFNVKASRGIEIDKLFGVGYHKTTSDSQPYYPKTFIDTDFNVKPSLEGWQGGSYDDSNWELTKLPFSQGSERHMGEDLYFRKKIKIDQFEHAYLNIEVLDPGGEIWVNGKMVALVKDRYPIRLDIAEYLTPFSENLIAIKVNHFYLNPSEGTLSPHSPMDKNPSWFAGRIFLDLTAKTLVNDAFLFTKTIELGKAHMQSRIAIEHNGTLGFNGKIRMKMGIWDNTEIPLEEVFEKPILIGPGLKKFEMDFTLSNPKLWEPNSPNLYKVVVQVEDENGIIIDDYVFTTGVRTVSQEGGTFRLNGKPAMLNGTQIMGFRPPLEKMMAWLRCPPDWWVAKELLQAQRMNCNMLRVHVHGWKEKAVGVNDPRYAQMADQMGIMIIMSPPGWIREGDWGQVDFEGFHKYMKQLQNHPAIVMWEVSNHPNTFKSNPDYESELFSEEAHNAVYPFDPSRIISITSHIAHMSFLNDKGTIIKGGRDFSKTLEKIRLLDPGNQMGLNTETMDSTISGEQIQAVRAWTAPMVTRGNQDAATGYGAEWSRIRKWPTAYYQGFLDSKERAYFNFEHQESIGQPNWNLSKGKPWYNLQSYEWGYDEGSIGRKLSQNEWRESQAWQAFSAYEATKKMRMVDYDGFSWCSLHGGPNIGTYKKPAIDFLGYGKLVFHIHKIMFQPILAGSSNVDVAYGPDDVISPMILNLGEERNVKLTVLIRDKFEGKVIDKKVYKNIHLKAGRTINKLDNFKPEFDKEGHYFIEYLVDEK